MLVVLFIIFTYMIYHVLNGDAIAEKFPRDLVGELIVIREAFMDGPVSETFDQDYWFARMQFVADAFDVDAPVYWLQLGGQLVKMREIKDGDTVALWFEDDLFCLINMLMAVNYIRLYSNPIFYRVFPSADEVHWRGFGKDDEVSLKKLFEIKTKLENADVMVMQQLWKAYVSNDIDAMQKLAAQDISGMRFLPAVIDAHIARLHSDEQEKQPQKILREIVSGGKESFEDIFDAFSKRAGIYGYGDVQIKKLLATIE